MSLPLLFVGSSASGGGGGNGGGPPPGTNACNGCDPAIPDTFYVDFYDLGGAFAPYNGGHFIEWTSSCTWQLDLGGGKFIQLYYSEEDWFLDLIITGSCAITFTLDANNCTPWNGSYAYYFCLDGDCAGACAASASATATVNWE